MILSGIKKREKVPAFLSLGSTEGTTIKKISLNTLVNYSWLIVCVKSTVCLTQFS